MFQRKNIKRESLFLTWQLIIKVTRLLFKLGPQFRPLRIRESGVYQCIYFIEIY